MTANPPPIQPPPPLPAQDQGIAILIPYKNGAALVAYYLGVLGLSRAGKNPQIRGKVHAWVGIILGTLVFLAHVAVIVLIAREALGRHPGIGPAGTYRGI